MNQLKAAMLAVPLAGCTGFEFRLKSEFPVEQGGSDLCADAVAPPDGMTELLDQALEFEGREDFCEGFSNPEDQVYCDGRTEELRYLYSAQVEEVFLEDCLKFTLLEREDEEKYTRVIHVRGESGSSISGSVGMNYFHYFDDGTVRVSWAAAEHDLEGEEAVVDIDLNYWVDPSDEALSMNASNDVEDTQGNVRDSCESSCDGYLDMINEEVADMDDFFDLMGGPDNGLRVTIP